MKIAIISPGFLPIPAFMGGAIETLTTHILNQNELRSNNINFIVFNRCSESNTNNIKYKKTKIINFFNVTFYDNIYDLFWRLLRIISLRRIFHKTSFIRKVSNYLKLNPVDVVLIEGNYTYINQLTSIINTKIIFHLHTDILNTRTVNNQEILKKVYKFIVVSNYLASRLLEIDNSLFNKIVVIKNVIDQTLFHPRFDINFKNKFYFDNRLNKDSKLILYCGRLSKEKGVLELITAFNKISLSNVYLLVIGSSWFSSEKKSKYVNKIKKLAKPNLSKIIFTGYVNNLDLPNYYSICEFSVVPSIGNEAAGLVLLESLSCGTPVLTTSKGGIPEYLDLNSSLVIDVNENFVKLLSDSIRRLIVDTYYYNGLKENALKYKTDYNVDLYYNVFIEEFNKQ
jgi:hypothetical protein